MAPEWRPRAQIERRQAKEAPAEPLLLSAFDRSEIHQALAGDRHSILHLLREWDTDAQLLSQGGKTGMQRLEERQLLRVAALARAPKQSAHSELYLPQTYAAASTLLSLCEPRELLALPSGFAESVSSLYPNVKEAIGRELTPYSLESLCQQQPDLAFIASYSQPSMVEALHQHGVPVLRLPDANSVQEVIQLLQVVAQATHHEEQGELLTLLIEGAFMHCSNRLRAHWQQLGYREAPRLLYLNHFAQFSLPCERTLNHDVLRQLGLNALMSALPETQGSAWSTPLRWERATQLTPDIVLISVEAPTGLSRSELLTHPAANQWPAVQNAQVFEIDNAPQQSPAPHLILAAVDITETLLQTHGGKG